MAINVDFKELIIGNDYDRPLLAKIWGYKGHQALSRGVVTPVVSKVIILFVTKEKQSSLHQYKDYIIDDFLYWEGEQKGSNNERILDAKVNRDSIHLFYRDKHHQNFKYLGLIELLDLLNKDILPYKYLFKILGSETDVLTNQATDSIFEGVDRETQKRSLALSRIGQGKFREDLFCLWSKCAVTEIEIPEILQASHIKPWKDSNNVERLDPFNGLLLIPNLDALFDKGLITFNDDGSIIISKFISNPCKVLNIHPFMKLIKVYEGNKKYLHYHRKTVYKS